jgi:hypothetical protein
MDSDISGYVGLAVGGGGIAISGGGTLIVMNSTSSGKDALVGIDGGGLANYGTLTVHRSRSRPLWWTGGNAGGIGVSGNALQENQAAPDLRSS